MLPPAFSRDPDSHAAREYEQLLQHAIIAVKNGNRSLAKKLLDQAARINSADARIWIWLSGTTDDLEQRRTYLKNALAVDPANQIAKRGLAVIAAQLDQPQTKAEERVVSPETPSQQNPPPSQLPTSPAEEVLPAESAPVAGEQISPIDAQETAPLASEEDLPPAPPEVPLPSLEEFLSPGPPGAPSSQEVVSKTYTCPNCGSVNTYNDQDTKLVCQFCGFTRKLDENLSEQSTPLAGEAVVPAEPPQRWVESQAHFTCEHCGVVILASPGQTIESCPYCASTRLVNSAGLVEFVDPQAIGLFTVNPDQAGESIKAWLGKGFLAPDNLATRQAGMLLHAAYYPFWLLSGTLEIPWFCDINAGSGNTAKWEAQTGSQDEKLNATLIPGLRRLSNQDLAEIGPFKLDELVEFSSASLEDRVILANDLPLADASLKARDRVVKKALASIASNVAPNRQKRNFRVGTARWSDLTSRLVLLPIYVGNYPFQGKRYRLLISGQTGKISGEKPVDRLKIALYSATALILLIMFFVLIWLLSR